jgi:hypothetical protein
MTRRADPTRTASSIARTSFTHFARAEEREEVIDRLRRDARLAAKASQVDAGLSAAARAGRRSYGHARHAVLRSSALLALSPDIDARQIHANTLLAARRDEDAVASFLAIHEDAPDRLYRDAAALGLSLGLSLLHQTNDARGWCWVALRSPFALIATNAALTLLVQSVRRGECDETRSGLDATYDCWPGGAPSVAARLLSRYMYDARSDHRELVFRTLQHSGPRGTEVLFHLDEVLRSCERS